MVAAQPVRWRNGYKQFLSGPSLRHNGINMAVTANQRLCKQPAEKRQFTMDFTNILGTGELITQITTVSSEKEGGYLTDLSITSTGIATGSKKVTMFIESGTLGNTYRIETLVTTDASQILEGDGILFITDM